MDHLDAMRVFVRVVERCSFTRTAEDLGLPRSTVTEAVKMLEARLDVPLLLRSTRHVRPTPDGERYARHCRSVLNDIEVAEASFSGRSPQGVVRASVHGTLARFFLLPHLPDFLARHPGLSVELRESDRLVSVIEEGFDCALRVGVPRDCDLMMRRVTTLPEVTLAAPAYLARHGVPTHPDHLHDDGHRMIGFWCSAVNGPMPLEFLCDGERRAVSLPTALTVSSAESYTAAAHAGLGIIQIPRYHAAAALAVGTLVELLPEFPLPAVPVTLLYPRSRHLAPRVQVFMDWVQGCFRA
ncbi:LysR family transcriptional regulator [Insolitispirillum peregrinum]|uniref:LysR family transcriptional regulator n=1 Tax=Insolitispirillum peregrinum TaxID=80876 RepID=UPI003616CF1F